MAADADVERWLQQNAGVRKALARDHPVLIQELERDSRAFLASRGIHLVNVIIPSVAMKKSHTYCTSIFPIG
jgi:hypothetical protein